MHKFIQISSGRGPKECEYAAKKILDIFIKDAVKYRIKTSLIEIKKGVKKDCIKSALISVTGDNPDSFINSWEGSILWVCKSPFRPNHKRKNWYIKVSVIDSFNLELSFNKNDVKIETMKASGPGGQHVNTTDSGVRITYIPENLIITAREERSQHLNKRLAFLRLDRALKKINEDKKSLLIKDNWSLHNRLERGNPIKTYKGSNFKKIS